MIWQIRSISAADTERIGEELGKLLKAPEVIELRSDLGGGKTTFIRGLTRGLGSTNNVVSPTFTLSRIYQAPQLEIHHYDFYRLSEPGILKDELRESLTDKRAITVIEWSDIVKGVLPGKRLIIEFKSVAKNTDERDIQIIYPESYEPLIKRLATNLTEVEP
jgi:tRNA threonylcarbamoyladenosine biosynthesis protein TsaE